MSLPHLASLLFVAILFQVPQDSVAQEFTSTLTGAQLLNRCRQATDILSGRSRSSSFGGLAQAAYCAGFVEAAADAGSFLGAHPPLVDQSDDARAQRRLRNCAGPAVRGEQLLRVVVRFLEDHSDSAEQAAVVASMLAIAHAFPCDTRAGDTDSATATTLLFTDVTFRQTGVGADDANQRMILGIGQRNLKQLLPDCDSLGSASVGGRQLLELDSSLLLASLGG
jgi:hypothetical protein